MPESFADHFSVTAADYARFRPDYPPALFDWITTLTGEHRLAWDCATGSGQSAVALGARFDDVVATDGSAAQLSAATAHGNVHYACAVAEQCSLRSASANVVTVAQALHWFDSERFYGEVNRIVVPGGAIVVWSYGAMSVAPGVDEVVHALYQGTLANYWPSERSHVDNGYRDLPFPFAPIAAPDFAMTRAWTLDHLLGYIGTWSAVQRFRRINGDEPLRAFAERLAARWGPRDQPREVRWPLIVRSGRVGAGRS